MRNIQYPHKKVKIVGNEWDIFVVPPKNKRLMKAWGITHFNEKEIYVANHLCEKSFKHTLTHELLHAYFDELGFHDILVDKLKTRQNEKLVDNLAKELMSKFRPDVFEISNFKAKGSC